MIAPRFGRVILAAAALLYAGLALGNGLDRWSLTRPGLPHVPAMLAAQSWRAQAFAALTGHQPEQARVAALHAVVAAPMEQSSASLLGSSYLALGQSRLADNAFKVAARMGWRDLPTQIYWVLSGIALSEETMAAQHLDALMRSAPDVAQSGAVLTQIEAVPAGQQAMVRQLAAGPAWIDQYAAAARGLSQDQFARRMVLLRQTAIAGHTPSCQVSSDAINALAYEQNRFAEARQLWDLACMQGRAGMVADPDFVAIPREQNLPFDWNFPGAGGVFARVVDGALLASNDNPVPLVVAQQYLMLPPGPIRIEWRASTAGNAAGLAQAVTLYCPNRTDLSVGHPAAVQAAGSFVADLLVPPDCAPQQLAVRIGREQGEVSFDAVNVLVRPKGP